MKMKRALSLFFAILMLITCVACKDSSEDELVKEETLMDTETIDRDTAEITTAADTEPAISPDTEKKELPVYKVLFIGNSFTYYNEMYNMFEKLVSSYGGKVTVHAVYKGGYYLNQFLDESDPYGKQAAIYIKKKYDVVFIQEQSMLPVSNPAKFYTNVRQMNEKIKQYGSKVYLYETWGYKKGHSSLTDRNLTTESMEMILRQNYTAIGEELGLPVSYAGAAVQYVYDNFPKINLFDDDLKHPSAAGSYLIACMHFCSLYGVSPESLEYNGGLSDSVAKTLQKAAADVYFSDPIKNMKKVSSLGVEASDKAVDYGVDTSLTVNLSKMPTSSLISVVNGNYGGKTFSGILGDIGKNSSTYSGTELTDSQKADMADIKYGVSVVGVKSMSTTTKSGSTFTGLGALVNGHWGSSWMANWTFDSVKYGVDGKADENGKYVGLITLNFGEKKTFDAIGYYSGSLYGFPQVADVYVSDDGVNWTLVPSACYDAMSMFLDGKSLIDLGSSEGDPWNNNSATTRCLFSMNGTQGKYIRIGVIKGRGESNNPLSLENAEFQLINTRELVVFGK